MTNRMIRKKIKLKFCFKASNYSLDWSWKVRYSSIKALVSVCRALNDGSHEELRQTCWASLVVCQENESEKHVLEAIKVGQIASKNEQSTTFKSTSSTKKPSTFARLNTTSEENIYFKIAKKLNDRMITYDLERNSSSSSKQYPGGKEQLVTKQPAVQKLNNIQTNSSLYEDYDLKSSRFDSLPIGKLTNVNKWSAGSKEVSSAHPSTRESYSKVDKLNKKRTTLREEILINEQFQNKIPDFFTRKNVDLMRIVEDQVIWRLATWRELFGIS
jgi:hypothetical protein